MFQNEHKKGAEGRTGRIRDDFKVSQERLRQKVRTPESHGEQAQVRQDGVLE